MRRVPAILLLLVLFPINGVSQQVVHKIHNGFLKARDYLEMEAENQRAYAMGILDGIYISPAFGAPDDSKALLSLETCVEGMKASQVAAIIEKYIRNHPEHWHWDLKEMAYSGMRDACPIK